jgi:glycosyltransferase involved in cell wall biosynthesis
VRILTFTGGAGAMFCGSCLRDNALATALMKRGHDVVLTPVYTPTRTEDTNVSGNKVFFNGISVFLEQHSPLFRRLPKRLHRVLESNWLLRLATRRQIKVDPQSLGELTVSTLRGEQGFQRVEIEKLLDWLKTERFDIVNLPYPLLLGLAEPIRRTLNAPVVCTLQGEDLFLDGLGEPYKQQSLDLIREASRHVDAFLPVSQYYADFMPGYLGVPAAKMRLAPLGINLEGFAGTPRERSGPFTIGYFARIAPEKGLLMLARAYRRLRARQGLGDARLVAAGYLAGEHREYLDTVKRELREAGLEGEFEYRGELTRDEKIRFLQDLDVFSVPTTYREPKGLFLMEAMAAGTPVVQPRHGAFPEMIERTGGGLLAEPLDPEALADGLEKIWKDPALARRLGAAGAQGVREHYSLDRMAGAVEAIYRELVGVHGHERFTSRNGDNGDN